jgi:hypothetical protein
MRNVLAAKSSDLQEFKLQFNCCGTGVEKVRARSSCCSGSCVSAKGCMGDDACCLLVGLELAVLATRMGLLL